MSDSVYGSLSDKSCNQCEISMGFFDRFAAMREKRMLTDIVLTSSDAKRFHVHHIVMAGSSDYFYEKLQKPDINDNTSEFISIDDPLRFDIHSSILELIISFCYMGSVTLTDSNIKSLLIAAGTLKIPNLLAQCFNAIDKLLNPKNCLQYIQIAKEHQMNDLIDKALDLIADNLIDVCKTNDFYRLSIPQMNWLLRNLSKNQNGLYDDLLKSLKRSESEFASLMPQLFTDSDTLSYVRSAFIVGYFKGTQNLNENVTLKSVDKSIGGNTSRNTNTETHSDSDHRYNDDDDDELDALEKADNDTITLDVNKTTVKKAQLTPNGTIVHMHKRDIKFSQFCSMRHEWTCLPTKIGVAHDIDTYKDSIIFPIGRHIYVFYIANGNISYVQRIQCGIPIVDEVLVPNDVKLFAAALFCLLNDEIYCFSRTEQNSFFKLDTRTNQWIFEPIENAMDCKCMVGLNDELYFIACGFHRTIVRSYNVLTRKWTARGGLIRSTQEDSIKAVTLNESIYVVLKCYDSSKIYNQTEFVVQTYDVEGNDWVIVKQIYTTHFIDRFYLHTAGYFLYLFHEDGKVYVYDDRAVDWIVLPAIKAPMSASAICVVENNDDETF